MQIDNCPKIVKMSNATQNPLYNIFQEILEASGNSSENVINETQIVSVLREQAAKMRGNESLESLLVKMMAAAQKNLPPQVVDPCEFNCGGELRTFVEAYNDVHGYITLVVCIVGVLCNAMNIAVLTRKDMAATPINRLLKWLALTDFLVMMEYIPFSIYKYLIQPHTNYGYSQAMYVLFHMHYGQIFHTASIFLTLSLAIWRYIALKYSDRSHILCSERRCSLAILFSFLLPPIFCIPTFMVFSIHKHPVTDKDGNQTTAYHVDSDHHGTLYLVNFWVHAVVVKLLPCVFLTCISLWLIRALYKANQHHKKMKQCTTCLKKKGDKRTDRSTKMLLAVLLLFLGTELPQGILGLMSGILGWCFFKKCYNLFGELMDFLALFNGSVSFLLYCAMSRQFRLTFRQMVCEPFIGRFKSPKGRNLKHPLVKFVQPTASHSDYIDTFGKKRKKKKKVKAKVKEKVKVKKKVAEIRAQQWDVYGSKRKKNTQPNLHLGSGSRGHRPAMASTPYFGETRPQEWDEYSVRTSIP